jgi:hypothetical protein
MLAGLEVQKQVISREKERDEETERDEKREKKNEKREPMTIQC